MASETGGTRPMDIAGRMARERERMLGMTDMERAWRKRYLQHQILVDEPVTPSNYYKERYNPIRRFYRAPMEMYRKALTPLIGAQAAQAVRKITSTLGFGLIAAYYGYYYIKYNTRDWTRRSGWRLYVSRPMMYPSDEGFPNYKCLSEGKEFYTLNFENSPI